MLQINDRALSPAFPFELVDPEADVESVNSHVTGEALIAHVQYHDPRGDFGTHWHFTPLVVPLGETRRYRARFVYTDYSAVSLTGDSPYRLRVSTPSEATTGIITTGLENDIISITGESIGSTQRIIELSDQETDTVRWETPPVTIEVQK